MPSHDGFKRLKHIRFGAFLKDAVYGANDGIVTTFAVVASVTGAALSPVVIVLVGIANLLADGFSMAVSNYLSAKSEIDFAQRERLVEIAEVAGKPDTEIEEVRNILKGKGYAGEDLESMVRLITKNERYWIDFMMHEELGFAAHGSIKPVKSAVVTFAAFIFAGSLPLAPFMFGAQASDNAFLWSVSATALALLAVGASRSFFTDKNWLIAGFEMLAVGGIAATKRRKTPVR